jgi:tetratricopeptide (TPR) repeat protein
VVPLDYAATQSNRAGLFLDLASVSGYDRRNCLLEALGCAQIAVLLFQRMGHAPYLEQATRQLSRVALTCGDLFPELWAELKLGLIPEWLVKQLETEAQRNLLLRALPRSVPTALEAFRDAKSEAQTAATASAWTTAAMAGQTLLELRHEGQGPWTTEELQAEVAGCWNQAGVIWSDQDKLHDKALAAFAEAIRVEPNRAMWHRNHCGTLIELGRLDEAEASLARAVDLEPGHTRLVDLRQELDAARGKT